jgi:hypothetical protein
MNKVLIAAVLFSARSLTPASAARMTCTGENMGKSAAMMSTGQNGRQQGNGHGQHGHEQWQDAQRLHALHEGPEDEHDEVIS